MEVGLSGRGVRTRPQERIKHKLWLVWSPGRLQSQWGRELKEGYKSKKRSWWSSLFCCCSTFASDFCHVYIFHFFCVGSEKTKIYCWFKVVNWRCISIVINILSRLNRVLEELPEDKTTDFSFSFFLFYKKQKQQTEPRDTFCSGTFSIGWTLPKRLNTHTRFVESCCGRMQLSRPS